MNSSENALHLLHRFSLVLKRQRGYTSDLKLLMIVQVAVYCADGTRSQLVVDFAKNVGLTHLEKIPGGYSANTTSVIENLL